MKDCLDHINEFSILLTFGIQLKQVIKLKLIGVPTCGHRDFLESCRNLITLKFSVLPLAVQREPEGHGVLDFRLLRKGRLNFRLF